MYPILILEGGLGTRLGNLTTNHPKSLISINGKPFIHWQLELLEKSSFKDVTLCLGHFSEQIVEYINKNYSGNLNISLSFDGEARIGTGGAIKRVSTKLDSPFFVIYGDSYLDVNFTKISESYNHNAGPLMTILHNNNLYDNSNVFIKNGNYFYQKISPPISANFIDFGLNIFEMEHFLNFNGSFDLSEVQQYYSKNKQLQFYQVEDRFYEIGSTSGIDELSNYLLKNEKNKSL